jgi:hypothetical protein
MSNCTVTFDEQIVSPELALIDSELATRARATLSDSPRHGVLSRNTGARPDNLQYVGMVAEDLGGGPKPWSAHGLRRGVFLLAAGAVAVTLVVAATGEWAPSGPPTALVQTAEAPTPVQTGRRGSAAAPVDPPGDAAIPGSGAMELGAPAPRRFAWPAHPSATGYEVEFFRGERLVFRKLSTRPELTVPATWYRTGERLRFEPGEYNWYVWPLVGGHRSAHAIVQSKLVIKAPL